MASSSSGKTRVCTHSIIVGGLCIKCGQKMHYDSGVTLGYVNEKLVRVSDQEIVRSRYQERQNLIRQRKLFLVLDLDHTLLNSTLIDHITDDEFFLKGPVEALPDALKSSTYRLNWMNLMTKLRPFVRNFLKEASKMFEMSVYTTGDAIYAKEMAKLLDPAGVYFKSPVIANVKNGADVVLGKENATLIVDDTENLCWQSQSKNLILIERYHFFASSVSQFFHPSEQKASMSQRKTDESEADGALSTVLRVLHCVHSNFFNTEDVDLLINRDVREVLQNMRKEVLKGCNLVFCLALPGESEEVKKGQQEYWSKLAVELGATCTTEVDSSVTHVVAWYSGSEKSLWAIQEKKLLVNPRWIDAARYLWQKQPEAHFPAFPLYY